MHNFYDYRVEQREQDQRRYDREERALRKAGTSRLQEEHNMALAHSRGRLYTMAHERQEVHED